MPRQWWIHHSSAEGNEGLQAVAMAVAAASSIGLQLSPWQTVKPLLEKESMKTSRLGADADRTAISGVPLFTMAINCTLWLTFGVLWADIEVVLTSLTGTLLGWLYTLLFLQKCLRPSTGSQPPKDGLAEYWYGALGCAVCLFWLLWCYCAVAPHEYATAHVGTLCLLSQVALYASPLTAALTWDAELQRIRALPERIPRGQAWWTVLSAFLWFLYGACVNDWFVIVPNALGTALGAVELYLIRRDSLARPKVQPLSFGQHLARMAPSGYEQLPAQDSELEDGDSESVCGESGAAELSIDIANARL